MCTEQKQQEHIANGTSMDSGGPVAAGAPRKAQ